MVFLVGLLSATTAYAAGTVSFSTPANNSTYAPGTSITPTGLASATGTTGDGLDLAIVIDVSGSTLGGGLDAEKAAAKALLDTLPAGSTSVTIIAFNSSAQTVAQLTPLTPSTNIDALKSAIDSLSSGGGTTIGDGIEAAAAELTGANATPGRSTQMVVLSDGVSDGNPAAAAAAAVAAGVDNIHSVAIPGADTTTMAAIATSGNGTFVDLTNEDLSELTSIFDGTGGSLVGIDHIEITLPDGTVINPNSISGIGAFTVDAAYNLHLGANTWTVTAYFSDQTSATTTVTVYASEVPVPAAWTFMLGGLGMMGAIRLRRRRA